MAFLEGYEYDIFISYAHRDNRMVNPNEAGWVKQFHDYLKMDLEAALGRNVKIWWDDRKLDGNEQFDGAIQDGVRKSAIMISLNSPSYSSSEWCLKESQLFYEKAQQEKAGLYIGHSSRLIHVLLRHIPFTKWPEQFEGRAGFHFYEKLGDEADEIASMPMHIGERSFNEELTKLRVSIQKLILGFEDLVESKPQPVQPSVEEPKDFTVFFADAPESLFEKRRAIISSLCKKGYAVLESGRDQRNAEAHESNVKDALSKADLCVHLLDQYAGMEIEGDPDNYYRKKQVELALETEVPQMIWVPDSLNTDEIENESYQKFVRNLEDYTLTDKPYDYIQGDKGSLLFQIADRIELEQANKKDAVQSKLASNLEDLDILLDYNPEDKPYAIKLRDTLEHDPFVIHHAPLGNDPIKNKSILHNRLSGVRKLVFLYGKASKDWIKERVSDAISKVIMDETPVEEIYIYLAPPKKSEDDFQLNQRIINQKSFNVNIINNSELDEVNDDLLEPFINDLKNNSHAV